MEMKDLKPLHILDFVFIKLMLFLICLLLIKLNLRQRAKVNDFTICFRYCGVNSLSLCHPPPAVFHILHSIISHFVTPLELLAFCPAQLSAFFFSLHPLSSPVLFLFSFARCLFFLLLFFPSAHVYVAYSFLWVLHVGVISPGFAVKSKSSDSSVKNDYWQRM